MDMHVDVDENATLRFAVSTRDIAQGEPRVGIWCIGGRPSAAVVAGTANAMETSEKLTSLALSDAHLDDAAATELARGVARCASLETLDIRSCNVTDDGMAALVAGVAGSKTLKTLRFMRMDLTPPMVAALADVVAHSTTIKSLNLGSCGVDDAGAFALAAAVAKSDTLTDLQLSFNALTDEGAVAIVAAVARKRQFSLLSLNSNQYSEAGTKEIARLVARSRSWWELVGVFSARSHEIVGSAYSLRWVANASFALMGQPTTARGRALEAFFKADGDHAAWSRVVEFLSGI